jgi:hypothetical protein
LDHLVTGLFEVSLLIAVSREVVSGPVASRLDAAVGRLDELIRDARVAAIAAVRADGPAAALDRSNLVIGSPSRDGAELDDIVGRLESVGSTLSALVDRDRPGTVHYRAAGLAVTNALDVLYSARLELPTTPGTDGLRPRRTDPPNPGRDPQAERPT